MKTKAQITFTILIAIILLLFIYLALHAFRRDIQQPLDTPTQQLRTFIGSCIQDTATYGLYLIGLQGGYVDPPPDAYATPFLSIPYAVNSVEGMEQDLQSFMDSHIPLCIATGLYKYKPLFQDIQLSTPKTTAQIQAASVSFTVEYPVTAVTTTSTTTLSQPYPLTFPIRLKHLHDIAETILHEQHNMKLQCLNDPGLSIRETYDNESNIFLLQDASSVLTNSPDTEQEYKFLFAKRG